MAGPLAKRSDGAVSRRRSSAAGRGKSGSSYFYTDASSVLKLSPQAVIVAAISFIVFVFVLHIFGKLRS
ncbi:expressed protein [Chlorella variabilis]|uniref:Expressed protein n=1 Tax=Chlorella variabilis TaxID=554065 RepID=E1ZJQ1_CHLVA|nr:expressed protein [Chlorella variabilis]EFN53904.1 expressed protein [Chlorella variabilis]|eukprot:XP_005846006.1 expressed protein [Chlorella variabilis]